MGLLPPVPPPTPMDLQCDKIGLEHWYDNVLERLRKNPETAPVGSDTLAALRLAAHWKRKALQITIEPDVPWPAPGDMAVQWGDVCGVIVSKMVVHKCRTGAYGDDPVVREFYRTVRLLMESGF